MNQFNIYAAYNDSNLDNLPEADKLAHEHFPDGWTRIHTTGGWHGDTEHGVLYQVLLSTDFPRPWSVVIFADKLRTIFAQQTVLVTRQHVESVNTSSIIKEAP